MARERFLGGVILPSDSYDSAIYTLGSGLVQAIETSPTNPKVRMDATGFFVTDASGNKLFWITAGNGLRLVAPVGSAPTNVELISWYTVPPGSIFVADIGAFQVNANSSELFEVAQSPDGTQRVELDLIAGNPIVALSKLLLRITGQPNLTIYDGQGNSDLAFGGSALSPNMDGAAAVGTSKVAAREDHRHPSDTSRIATSALSGANPNMDGAAAPGTSTNVARADHVHPSDTSRIATSALSGANPNMDGAAAPGASTDVSRADHVHPSDTSRIATSALSGANPSMDGAAAPGTSTNVSRADHVHPSDTSKLDANTNAIPPIGSMMDYAGSSDPNGNWLICDGRAISRTTYATLFALIGGVYGVGDGSTTFNIPDMRGRASIGQGQGSGLTNRALGASGGEENHTLVTAELPSHQHTITMKGSAGSDGGGPARGLLSASSTVVNTGATGSDSAHNNMQPYRAVGKTIRVL